MTIRLFALPDDAEAVDSAVVAPDMCLAASGRVSPQVQAWLPTSHLVRKVVIEIDDPDNAAGYVEVGRLCIGKRVDLTAQPGYGAALKFVDRSKSSRAESGDLRIEQAGTYRTLELDFAVMPPEDAEVLMLIAAKGIRAFVFISLFPGDAIGVKSQAYAFFASPTIDNFGYPFLNLWSNKLTLEEIA